MKENKCPVKHGLVFLSGVFLGLAIMLSVIYFMGCGTSVEYTTIYQTDCNLDDLCKQITGHPYAAYYDGYCYYGSQQNYDNYWWDANYTYKLKIGEDYEDIRFVEE